MITINKKGMTIVEVLVTLLIIGVISSVMTSMLVFGFDTFNTSSRNITQHDLIIDITNRIKKDISECVAYKFTPDITDMDHPFTELTLQFPDNNRKSWKFQDGKLSLTILKYQTATGLYASTGSNELKGLETNKKVTTPTGTTVVFISKFEKLATNDSIQLVIKPSEVNKTRFKERNVNKPIITEFSVRYKGTIS